MQGVDVHLLLIITMYFLFSLIAIVIEINRITTYRVLGIVSLCRLMYVLLVAIVPGFILCAYLVDGTTAELKYENRYIWTFYAGAIATIATYLMFTFGYHIEQKKVPIKNRNYLFNTTLLASIFVAISVISLFLWASGFGGVSALIFQANSIRAGFVVSSSNVAFFKHFVPLAMLAAFLVFNKLVVTKDAKNNTELICLIVLFVISVIISVVYILANDGRMLAGIFIMLFFLLLIKNEYEVKKKSLKKIVFRAVILIAIVVAIILNADNIFRIMREDEILTSTNDDTFFQTISGEFSFIVSSLQTAIMKRTDGTASLTILNDVVNGIFAWLPTSLKPIILPDVWDYNTQLINAGTYGQSPTTIVSQSIYDLGIVGVVVIPTLYGVLVKKIENILDSYQENPFTTTVYIVLGFYLGKGMVYFSAYNIMMNIFFIVIGSIIFTIFNKVTIGGK